MDTIKTTSLNGTEPPLEAIPPITAQDTVSVSNLEFAEEVRAERLRLFWQVIFWLALFWLWIAFMRRNTNGDTIAVVSTIALVGAVLTGQVSKRGYYTAAAWVLNMSLTLAITYPVTTGNMDAIQIVPFVYPFIVFLMGMMLPPIHTFILLGLTTLLTFLGPVVFTGNFSYLSVYPFIAWAVAIFSALVSAQVAGELYQITNWALENYARERRSSLDLFDKRQALQKSLQRSQVLGEKLQEINDQLESAKHFRGQFLANMSHELRTPLNAIIGFSETMLSFPMMYDDVELPDAYRRDLEQIHTSGQQLLTVINDILDLSKVDAGKLEINLERVQLDPVIDNAMMMAAGLLANKPVELKRDLSQTLPDVYADESRLRQVILNLYSNAAKFTDEGSITILVSEPDAENVQISVIDTGEGIKPEALEIIFEEFTQADNQGRDPRAGAGLGLTISRKLLSLMDGHVWAESTYGQGSTFHVVVPRFRSEAHNPDTEQSTNKAIAQPTGG